MSSKAPAIGAVVAFSGVLIGSGLWCALGQSPIITTPRRRVPPSELEAYKAWAQRRRRAIGFRLAGWTAILGVLAIVLIAVL
jgi:hypothetical protein